MTHFTLLWLGTQITAAVLAIASALPGSAIVANVLFDTSMNTFPAIYSDTYRAITFDGSSTVTFPGYTNQSGGLVPLTGAITWTEVNTYASGSLAILNPFTTPLMCKDFVLDITTNSSPATQMDVYVGTGALGTMGKRGGGSGTKVIANNFASTIAMTTLSGSAAAAQYWKLCGSADTTCGNRINLISLDQTGSLMVGTYHVNCFNLK